MRELYGLFGDPVDHSLSPVIQAVAFDLLARPAAYLPFRIPAGELEAGFAAARQLGIRGLNVTIPHKERAAALVDRLEGDAAAIRAANVVVREDNLLVGHNTDTIAVRTAVERLPFDVAGQRVLVLGSGGAARAAAFALGSAGASEVVVANRTFARARDLCALLSRLGIEAVASPYVSGALRELVPMSQVIVNATSVGLHAPEDSPLPATVDFNPGTVVIDMVYRPLETRLLLHAREQGAQTIDGLEILIRQAIESLRIWLNRPIDAAWMMPAMRAAAIEALS
jgi:shikimate dehydrogenase